MEPYVGTDHCYVLKPSHWPFIGSLGLTATLVGAASWLHNDWYGSGVFICVCVLALGWINQE